MCHVGETVPYFTKHSTYIIMDAIKSIGFAVDPTNIPSFLLDWELTKLCNLNCSYCSTGIEGGHDNNTDHPLLDECLRTIDFMYEYVDLYMKARKITQRKVVLNLYGGESLFHPNIVEIIQACRDKYKNFKNNWYLTITCTTNGVVGMKQWQKIVPLIDEFTISYHCENLPKQKQQYKDNVLYLKNKNRKFKCVVMMHNDAELFKEAEEILTFCQQNNLKYVAKPLDNFEQRWSYTKEQFQTLKTFWINKTTEKQQKKYSDVLSEVGQTGKVQSINQGRPCCGGRKLCINNDMKSSISFVPKQGFKDWYCSVNWFFLFVQQVDGAVFTNKDCMMSTTGVKEPLGFLNKSNNIIDTLKQQIESKTMPIIKCKKDICMCGFCAPKAENLDDFLDLVQWNVPKDILQLHSSK